MQAFVEARYAYHWTPLVGCLTAQLLHIGLAQPSYAIGTATGVCYQPPDTSELPARLEAGLAAVGAASTIVELDQPSRLRRFLARRQIRRELGAGRAVTAFGVGVSAFGPAWGLIVGCDDERRAWRRDGPMTDQVSPWLAESEFNAAPRLITISLRKDREPSIERLSEAAALAFVEGLEPLRCDLLDRIALLESAVEIEPQRYSHEAQTLAANWGELATFWREHPHSAYTPIAQQLAVTLSRYATLFPYPMGGQPNSPGVRTAAVHILREAAERVVPR